MDSPSPRDVIPPRPASPPQSSRVRIGVVMLLSSLQIAWYQKRSDVLL